MSGQSIEEKTREFEGNDFDSPTTEMSIDRLSALPDGILIHILSFLGGVEKSAVTSVLSKRWKFIWAELPKFFFFEFSGESEKRRSFVSKVNRTLLIRTGAGIHLEEFRLLFEYNESFASDVDSWVDFVLKHKVKKVDLLLNAEDEDEIYALPETMCSNSSLTRFSLRGCRLDTLKIIEWPFLTCLHVEDSELPQHVVENILSGCPVLHTLELDECWGFSCLDVKSQNLCQLHVKDRKDGRGGNLLEIAAPYVHSLDLSFFSKGRKLVLRNIKSLVRAQIDLIECRSTSYGVVLCTVELFETLNDVKELMLGKGYLKVLSELVANGWQLPVSRRKFLTLNTFRGVEHNISGIFAMLKFSPNLERLTIYTKDFLKGETWDEAAPGDLDCDLLHLKTVEIMDFGDPAFGSELMLTVARTLLMRAKVLEEMKIVFRVKEMSDNNKIGLTLLNYPRSSEKAVVRLHQL